MLGLTRLRAKDLVRDTKMAKYQFPNTVLFQDVVTETVILDTRKGSYFTLNEMGTEMLRLLRKSGDPTQVVRSILENFDVTQEEVSKDLEKLIQDLEQQGLLIQET